MIDPQVSYLTVFDRLKRVQHICGQARVTEILRQYRAKGAHDLQPRDYAKVIWQCEFVVSSARTWEAVLSAKEQVVNPSRAVRFKDAVDVWLHACDRELQLTSPELYNDKGEPLD